MRVRLKRKAWAEDSDRFNRPTSSVVEVLRGLGFKRGFEPYIDRMMDLPSPDGSPYFFEGMRNDEQFKAFGDDLRDLARQNYGLAGPHFLQHLVDDLKDRRDRLQAFCAARQERFWKAAEDIESQTGRNLTRAKNRYATIYMAGCLAISYGILPFTESELLDAVWTCLRDHVAFIEKEFGVADAALNATPPDATAEKAYRALQEYVDYYWKAGLIDLRKPGTKLPQGHDHANALGYVGKTNKAVEIWLPGPRFEKIAGGAREARLLKRLLARRGMLATWGSGKQSRKSVVRRLIPGFEDGWVVAIKLPKEYATRSMRLGVY
jgi:hypothetical protein